MSSKTKKRFDRLISCVKSNNVERLKHYARRKKYAKLHLDEIGVNKKGETLLHLACRQGKHEIVAFLLENSIGDPTSMDCKGNTPLHLALKAIMKIDERNEYLAGKLFSKSKVNKETSTFKYFSLQENDTCTS
jgi:ankyrin repeat protein